MKPLLLPTCRKTASVISVAVKRGVVVKGAIFLIRFIAKAAAEESHLILLVFERTIYMGVQPKRSQKRF